jgi:vitamin K-dependent gamma-carboxylase
MMKLLYRPIDSAILIYFRIVTGILMGQELINGIIIGKFHEYVTPRFHFSYMFFEWVKPWPYWGMVVHYAVTIFAAFAVAFNFHYRLFSVILFLGYTSLFLFDQTEYINHFYLYCLISFWMMFLPLNKSRMVQPAWMLYLVLFHMSLAYFFGGIAKLNPDWLSGTPMDIFLSDRKNLALGTLYSQKWAPFAFSYGGLMFDLLIVPLMIFRPTRLIGFAMSILFHLSNVLMFGLATFPWFSLLLTTMFFDPSWPRRIPLFRSFLPWGIERAIEFRPNKALVSALCIYALIHVSLPLRHLLYPGMTNWTEEGHMFSWRMMLRSKSGTVNFFVKKKDSAAMEMANPLLHITQRQYEDIIGKPDLILQFAHYLRDYYQDLWKTEVAVYASSRVSLNGRKFKEMIEPGTDLAREKRTLLPYKWVRGVETEADSRLVRFEK